MSRRSTVAVSTLTPALKVLSMVLPVSTFLSLVRTNAGPLPGLTCWNSMMVHSCPSIWRTSPFLKSLVEATCFASPRNSGTALDDGQVLAGQREQFRALFTHHERVLDPDASASREVHTRLDGHRRTAQQCTGAELADSRRFVNLEADTVTETVQEQLSVSRVLDDLAGRGVHRGHLRPRCQGRPPCGLGARDEVVDVPLPVRDRAEEIGRA